MGLMLDNCEIHTIADSYCDDQKYRAHVEQQLISIYDEISAAGGIVPAVKSIDNVVEALMTISPKTDATGHLSDATEFPTVDRAKFTGTIFSFCDNDNMCSALIFKNEGTEQSFDGNIFALTNATDILYGKDIDSTGSYGGPSYYEENHLSSLTSVTLNDGLMCISPYAFQYAAISSVNIPNSVTSIGDFAFHGTDLTSIQLPASITSIGNGAFSGTKLSTVVIPANIRSINDAFSSTDLTGASFENASNIASATWCFANTQVSSVDFISGLSSIFKLMFAECSNLQRISIPQSVKSIDGSAFTWCQNLQFVDMTQTHITSIGECAFERTGQISVLLPSTISYIGQNVFFMSPNKSYVVIPDDIMQIPTVISKSQSDEHTFDDNTSIIVPNENVKQWLITDQNWKSYESQISVVQQ